jgi:hypothetical protein
MRKGKSRKKSLHWLSIPDLKAVKGCREDLIHHCFVFAVVTTELCIQLITVFSLS